MSRSSRDLYYSSSSRSAGESHYESHYGNLPPIREVVGDVLQQPVRPYSNSREGHRATDRSYTPSAQGHASSRGHHSAASLQLAPINSSRSSDSSNSYRYAAHSSSTSRNYYTSSPRPSSQPPPQQESSSRRGHGHAHSYDIFVSSSSDGLIHKRSSDRDDFHHVPKEDAIASSTGRHVCGECGRRFEKLSTLKNHLTTHSGEKPFECPDCGKCFSVSSNMRRHQLTHRTVGTSSSATR